MHRVSVTKASLNFQCTPEIMRFAAAVLLFLLIPNVSRAALETVTDDNDPCLTSNTKFSKHADSVIEVRKQTALDMVMATFIKCMGANESTAERCAKDVPDSIMVSDDPAGSKFVTCANISPAETLKAECKENLTSDFMEVEVNTGSMIDDVMTDLCGNMKSPLCSFTGHKLNQSFNYKSCIPTNCTEAKLAEIFHLEIDCPSTPSQEKSSGVGVLYWVLGALLLIAVLAVAFIMWRKQSNT